MIYIPIILIVLALTYFVGSALITSTKDLQQHKKEAEEAKKKKNEQAKQYELEL